MSGRTRRLLAQDRPRPRKRLSEKPQNRWNLSPSIITVAALPTGPAKHIVLPRHVSMRSSTARMDSACRPRYTAPGGDALADEGFCDNRVKRLATINFDDERGLLSPIDFSDHGFSVVRAFTISGTLGAV